MSHSTPSPIRTTHGAALARPSQPAAGNGMIAYLKHLSFSQWLILVYPVFLFAIRRRRESDDVAGIDTSAIFQMAFIALCALHVLRRLTAGHTALKRILIDTPVIWLLLYNVLAVISTAWSGIPMLTLFRGVQVLVFLIVLADAVASFEDAEAFIKFQLLFAITLAIAWQYSELLYGVSISSMHSSSNPGTMLGISIAGYLILDRRWQYLWAAVIVSMILGTSAAAYASLVIGISLSVMMMKGKKAVLGLIMVGLLVLIIVAFPSASVQTIFYGKESNQILNGTGRVPVWDWLLRNKVSDRPLLGFGFGYGEVQARLFNEGGLKMMHMHNAVMSALVNLGIIGAVLLFGFWINMFRALWRIRSHPSRPVLIAAVFATLLDSLTMESISAPLSYGWLGHLMIYMLAIQMGASTRIPVITRRFAAHPSRAERPVREAASS